MKNALILSAAAGFIFYSGFSRADMKLKGGMDTSEVLEFVKQDYTTNYAFQWILDPSQPTDPSSLAKHFLIRHYSLNNTQKNIFVDNSEPVYNYEKAGIYAQRMPNYLKYYDAGPVYFSPYTTNTSVYNNSVHNNALAILGNFEARIIVTYDAQKCLVELKNRGLFKFDDFNSFPTFSGHASAVLVKSNGYDLIFASENIGTEHCGLITISGGQTVFDKVKKVFDNNIYYLLNQQYKNFMRPDGSYFQDLISYLGKIGNSTSLAAINDVAFGFEYEERIPNLDYFVYSETALKNGGHFGNSRQGMLRKPHYVAPSEFVDQFSLANIDYVHDVAATALDLIHDMNPTIDMNYNEQQCTQYLKNKGFHDFKVFHWYPNNQSKVTISSEKGLQFKVSLNGKVFHFVANADANAPCGKINVNLSGNNDGRISWNNIKTNVLDDRFYIYQHSIKCIYPLGNNDRECRTFEMLSPQEIVNVTLGR